MSERAATPTDPQRAALGPGTPVKLPVSALIVLGMALAAAGGAWGKVSTASGQLEQLDGRVQALERVPPVPRDLEGRLARIEAKVDLMLGRESR